MARRSTGAAALMFATALSAAGTPGLEVSRLSGSVERNSGWGWSELTPVSVVAGGEQVRTGENGFTAMDIGVSGRVIAGPQTDLAFEALERPDPPARAERVRLVLQRGTLRLSTGGASPPADAYLAVGDLRLRVFGAQVWVDRSPFGDEICLLDGAVEISAPKQDLRLDQPGACLRATGGRYQLRSASEVGSLASRLALTPQAEAYDALPVQAAAEPVVRPAALPRAAVAAPQAEPDGNPVSSRTELAGLLAGARPARLPAAAPAPATVEPPPAAPARIAAYERPSPAPQALPAPSRPAAPRSAHLPVETDTLTPDRHRYAIVLASLQADALADEVAAEYEAKGLDVYIVSAHLSGGTRYRVVTGQYLHGWDAEADLDAVRSRSGETQAWVARVEAPGWD